MDLGFAVPLAGSWATPANQVLLARRAEELGYASLWTFQRLLYPADVVPGRRPAPAGHPSTAASATRSSPWPSSRPRPSASGSAWPCSTCRGSRRCCWPSRPPAWTPSPAAGWTSGSGSAGPPRSTPPPARRPNQRGARAEEFVACLRACWTDPVVDFHGRFHDVGPAYVDPKPVQRPHPPLLLGGGVDAALRRAGRIADGWISSSGQDLSDIGTAAAVVRGAARDAGRDPAAVRIVCRGVVKIRDGGPRRPPSAHRLVRRGARRPRRARRPRGDRGVRRPQLRPRHRLGRRRPGRLGAAGHRGARGARAMTDDRVHRRALLCAAGCRACSSGTAPGARRCAAASPASARNLPDGRVEVRAGGPGRRGGRGARAGCGTVPPQARVESVEVSDGPGRRG